jgi:hypothetical protein
MPHSALYCRFDCTQPRGSIDLPELFSLCRARMCDSDQLNKYVGWRDLPNLGVGAKRVTFDYLASHRQPSLRASTHQSSNLVPALEQSFN